jgi:outer membrane immunogenic protein
MRRISLALAATTALTFAALGAGIQSASAAPATYNWTGFYIGGNIGYGWGTANTTTDVPGGAFSGVAAPVYSSVASPSIKNHGFTGGVQIGLNQQVNNWVWGIEADFNALALRGSADTAGTPAGSVALSSHTEVNTDWLATLRPRIGWAANNWLLYATGGLAITKIKYSQVNTFAIIGPEQASVSKTKAGWTIGGGVESALPNNWSWKAEYLYVSFGSVATTAFDPAGLGLVFNHSTDLKASIVRLGVNHKF